MYAISADCERKQSMHSSDCREALQFFLGNLQYRIAGKFGGESLAQEEFDEFGELSVICHTKTIQISTYNL